jgi:hypothetical protein
MGGFLYQLTLITPGPFYKMEKITEKLICIKEVRENILRVETGQPLTKPLKLLNQFCDFRKKFEEMDKIYHGKNKVDKEKMREYRKRPEVKKRMREYNKRPEVKKRKREYRKRPEVKKRKREYYQKKKNDRSI